MCVLQAVGHAMHGMLLETMLSMLNQMLLETMLSVSSLLH